MLFEGGASTDPRAFPLFILTFIFFLYFLLKKIYSFQIAIGAVTGDGEAAGSTNVAYLSEVFPFLHLGDVNLRRRYSHSLYSIQQRNAGMCVCTGIYNYSVHAFKIGLLNSVHKCTLVV